MKKMPLVSVIIPMYNAEKYIQETLTSLKNQSYDNYEVIIVDNASTDNSVSVAQEMSSCFKSFLIVKSDVNSGGPAKPRNIGIEHSSGEYIAFLDADDLWEPKKLSYQIDIMIRDGFNFTCVSPSAVNEMSEKIVRLRDILSSNENKSYGLKTLLFRNSITTSSVVISKKLLGPKIFNESKSIVTCEDYLLWLNLFGSDSCSFLHIGKKLVKYRVISTSLGNKDGKYAFATKSLLASSDFLVENKRYDLVHITVFSNLLRLLKLFIFRFN
tara:strand:- start:7026 stop:7835 length:810 start_codon:yes stop_codon:yes gene_type:complete